MKKRLSLVLAMILVAATLLSAIPFSAVAAEFKVPQYAATINGKGVQTLELAVMYANASKVDVAIELLKDVEIQGVIEINPVAKKEDKTPVKVTIDGNGHTIKTAAGNFFQLGGPSSGNPNGTNNIAIEDLVIDYSGAGSVIQVYSGGDFLLENIDITCSEPLTWTAINMNIGDNGENNVANVTMKNVDVTTLAVGGNGGKGDPSIIRTGNAAGNAENKYQGSPYSNVYMENCDLLAVGGEKTAGDSDKNVIGLHPTSCNGNIEMVNCTITTQNKAAIYMASAASSSVWADADGKPTKQIVKLVDTTVNMVEEATDDNPEIKRPEWIEVVNTEGKFTPVTDFTVYVGEEAPIELTTLADALKAVDEATGDVTLSVNKDVTITEAIVIKNAAGNKVVVDFNGNTATTSAGNAFKFGEAGGEQDITFKNAKIEYSGAGSVLQVYTAGTVAIEDVMINSTGKLNYCAVNALNNKDTTLDITITDCFIVGADEGNQANAGLIRTGNGGNVVNMTVDGTVVIATGTATTNPITPLNITSVKATVAIKNSVLIATTNSAILLTAEVENKVTVENTLLMNQTEAVEVISNEALVELDEKSADNMFGGPQPVETTKPEETTKEPVEETTPAGDNGETTEPQGGETTTAPVVNNTQSGCGGIAIVAQLVALVCAAAAVLVIKKK